jgi:hypothetical protein
MGHRLSRLVQIGLASALVILVALGTTGIASGKKHKPLKVTCEQLYGEIEKTGAQLQAKFNAMGFTIGLPEPVDPGDSSFLPGRTIDGFVAGQACRKQGKRIRQGVGYMNDINSPGEPPFPGETNPNIKEYFWTWGETVTRTKKGALRDTITSIRCEKYASVGTDADPNVVFPC